MVKRKDIEEVYNMDNDSLVWKPLYPNNMKCNGVEGYYCLIFKKNDDGIVHGRKYTILFQHEEIDEGTGLVDPRKINAYILFEKSYWDVIGPLEYPEATDKEPYDLLYSNGNTLTSSDMNDKGSFIYAYRDMESAKKRALRQFQAIYGYVASHFIED